MAKKVKAFVLSSTILAMLLFSAFGTITVYADDGSGTAATGEATAVPTGEPEEPGGSTTDVVVADPTSDEVQPTDVVTPEVTPLAEESAPPDPATAEAAPAADGVPPAEQAGPVTATEPILEQVPDNTTVTVLNTEGEAVPLVSQEAADAIASDYDPIWCPAGQTPTPGENNCTESFASFDLLLDFLQTNQLNATYQQAGTIYIQQGNYLGGESSIDFNDYDLSSSQNYDLTLQGGWDVADNSVDSTTSFDIPIIIGSSTNLWVGSLTLNDILIDGVLNDTGLTLYTEGDITLSNVTVTGSEAGADLNAGNGADDDVTISDSAFNDNQNGGAKIKAGGKVNVSNSQFNGNSSSSQDGYGLNVNSGAGVTLAGIHADNNDLYGADVTAIGDVTVTASFFSGNLSEAYVSGWQLEGFGIQVTTAGNIKLDGITADGNYLFGANLTGVNVQVANSSFSDNSSNWAEQLTGSGLQVDDSTGNVTLTGVNANNNQLFGADIQTTGAVKVTDSFFNGNASYRWSMGDRVYEGYGISIVTDSEVSLVNIEAEENYLVGAHVEGLDVAIDGGRFSNNGSGDGLYLTGGGLEVISADSVSLASVTADNNQLFGANVRAGDPNDPTSGPVAIENSSFSGHLTYVYDSRTHNVLDIGGGYGLNVVTSGVIALADVTADNNYEYGAYLEGSDVAVEGVLGVSSFSGNGSGVMSDPPGNDLGYGLKIVSSGSVSLFNINSADSLGNQLFGADITAAGDVTITNAFFSHNQSVTFDPCTQEMEFFGYGLNVATPGAISLDGVVANFNNLWGAQLDNNLGDPTVSNSVFVFNSQFNNNISDSDIFIDDTGLIIDATGLVSIYNTEAIENRLIGATITSQSDVFIDQSRFLDNRGFTCSLNWCPDGSITYHGYGLQVTTPGHIEVTNTNASGNNLFGAQLNGGTVTVTGGTYNDNRMGDGLIINATNGATLTNVTAVNNGGDGVQVESACGNVIQVTGGTFTDNELYGIRVINSTLNLDGAQDFDPANGSGNVFAEGACALVIVTPPATSNTSAFVNGLYTGGALREFRNHLPDKGFSVAKNNNTASTPAFVNASYSDNQKAPKTYTHRMSRRVANHSSLMSRWVRGMV